MGTRTPWGISDQATKLMSGIISYSTPGHGGIHVKASLNEQIHPAWRNAEGWYEEDCCWAIVAYHFPQAFQAKHVSMAIKTLKNSFPYEYMKVTGRKLKPSQSNTLREDRWKEKHKNHYVVLSAWGDWHPAVPKGMVGVYCCRGGYLRTGTHASADFKYFLVPKEEYTIPFALVEEKKYKEIPAIH